MLDCFVGAVVGQLKLAVRAVFKVRLVVETTVGERPAQTFVEEQEQQRNLDAL